MKILITGANSYLGARLFLDLEKTFEVIGTYRTQPLSSRFIQLDVTNKKHLETALSTYKPNIIIHAANNANARWCEQNPKEATLINVKSTEYIVQLANTNNIKIMYISSFSAKNPSNIYGKNKYESEQIVADSSSGYLIIRPSLIVGGSPNSTNDRPFNRLLKNIDEHILAQYDTSWKFQPTYAGHISEVITQCIQSSILNETIAVASPELVTRYDLARDILSPFSIEVHPINNNDHSPIIVDNLSVLDFYALPKYTYKRLIESCINDIKQRHKFQIL